LNHPVESGGTTIDQLYDTPVCTAVDPTFKVITIKSCLETDTTDQSFSTATEPTGMHTCNELCRPYMSPGGPFCPAVAECAFNHIMWYTSKNFADSGTYQGTGDGNIFSAETGVILNMSSYVQ
jgi:hypothetical protein